MFNEKIMTAQEAAKVVRSGDRVYVGTASSFASSSAMVVTTLRVLPGPLKYKAQPR